MNILFYLLPKKEVAYILDHFTIRQALEKMEYHHYSTIPVLNENGEYLYSISEGDFLWYIKNHKLNFNNLEKVSVSEIKPAREIKPIRIDAKMTQLLSLIVNQNYVPVIDDRNTFIGIVTRRSVITYFTSQYAESIEAIKKGNS